MPSKVVWHLRHLRWQRKLLGTCAAERLGGIPRVGIDSGSGAPRNTSAGAIGTGWGCGGKVPPPSRLSAYWTVPCGANYVSGCARLGPIPQMLGQETKSSALVLFRLEGVKVDVGCALDSPEFFRLDC